MAVLPYILGFMYVFSLYIAIFLLLIFLKMREDGDKRLAEFNEADPPFVTIAIPAYNEEETIEATVKSVLELDYPHDKIEAIIINDGSKDSTREIVEKIVAESPDRQITLINKVNEGKGIAMNTALRLAKGKFFTCLDADSFIRSDALRKMLPVFSDDGSIAAVLPLMKVKKPNSWLQKVQWCEYLLNFFYKSIMSYIDCIHVAPGPFSVYRKSIIEELGGFSEHNLTEDLEISLRIQKADYKIVQTLDTEVYTMAPTNMKEFYKQRNRWYKGSFLNMLDYREMLFNRKYGDFGVFQLPRVFLSGFIAITFIGITFYYFLLRPAWKWFERMGVMDFDLIYVFKKAISNFLLVDINIRNIFFLLVSLVVSLYILKKAYEATNEKVFKYGFLPVPVYLVMYGFMAAGVWLGVFIDMLFKKRQKW